MDSESFHYRGDYFVFVHFGQRATDNFDYSSFLSSLDVNQLCSGHLKRCVERGKGGLFSALKSPPSSEAKTSRRFNCDSDHPEVTDSHGRGRSRRTEDEEAQARAKIKSQ